MGIVRRVAVAALAILVSIVGPGGTAARAQPIVAQGTGVVGALSGKVSDSNGRTVAGAANAYW